MQDHDTLTPTAREVHDRYQVMIDQGKVCPLCGAPLVITWPCKGGEHNGELFISIQCSLNKPDTGETCEWGYDPVDEWAIDEIPGYEAGRACDLHGGCLAGCCE